MIEIIMSVIMFALSIFLGWLTKASVRAIVLDYSISYCLLDSESSISSSVDYISLIDRGVS